MSLSASSSSVQRDVFNDGHNTGKNNNTNMMSCTSFTDFLTPARTKHTSPRVSDTVNNISPRGLQNKSSGVRDLRLLEGGGGGDKATLIARIKQSHPSYSNWTAELVAYQITQATEALEEEKRIAYIKEQQRRAEVRANQITKLLDVPELTDADGNPQSVNKSRVWLAQNSPRTLNHYEEILSQAMQLEQHRRRGHADGIASMKEDNLRTSLQQKDLEIEANVNQQRSLRRMRYSKEDPWTPRAAKKRDDAAIANVSQRKAILEASEQSIQKHNNAATKNIETRSKEAEERRQKKVEKASKSLADSCHQANKREDNIRQGIERKVAHVAFYSEMEAEARAKAAAQREAVMISVSETVERTQLEKTALSYLTYLVKESHTIFRKQSVNDWATYVTALKRKERDEKASVRLMAIDDEDDTIRKQLSTRQKERIKAALIRHESHWEEKQLHFQEVNRMKVQRSHNPHPPPPPAVPHSPRLAKQPHPPSSSRRTPSSAQQRSSLLHTQTRTDGARSPPTTNSVSLPPVQFDDITSQARVKSFPRATPFSDYINKSKTPSNSSPSKKMPSSTSSSSQQQISSSPISSPRRHGDAVTSSDDAAPDDPTTTSHSSGTGSLVKHMTPEERLQWEASKLLKLKLANERKATDHHYRSHAEASKSAGRFEAKHRHEAKQFEKWSKVIDSIDDRNEAIRKHSMEQEQQRIQLLERAEERRMAANEKRLQNELAREAAADAARAAVTASQQQSGKQSPTNNGNTFAVISGEKEKDRAMIAAIWGSYDSTEPHQQTDVSTNKNSPRRQMTMRYLNHTQSSQEASEVTANLRAALKNEAIENVKDRAREHNTKIEDTRSAWRQQLLHDANTKSFDISRRRVEAAGQRREEALAVKSAKGASMSLTVSR